MLCRFFCFSTPPRLRVVPLVEASSHCNHAYHLEHLTRNDERSMAGTGKIGQMTWVKMRKRVLEKGEGGKRERITSGHHYSRSISETLCFFAWFLILRGCPSFLFILSFFQLDSVIPLLRFRALQPVSRPDLRQTITTDQKHHTRPKHIR